MDPSHHKLGQDMGFRNSLVVAADTRIRALTAQPGQVADHERQILVDRLVSHRQSAASFQDPYYEGEGMRYAQARKHELARTLA